MPPQPPEARTEIARGIALVAAAAIVWSFGGAIARSIHVADSWTVVFWRSAFAAAFLLAFMLVRDGPQGTARLLTSIGPAGLGVAACFAVASTSFVVALAHTTVANILVIQAASPMIAAILTWALFRERIAPSTWAAAVVVMAGIAIMVSGAVSAELSLLGDGLALAISFAMALATVITRRRSQVRMTPAVFLAMLIACAVSAAMSTPHLVGTRDFALLFAFGALNLGLGLALFVTGARLVPAALAALVGAVEPVLGPLWVWLIHGEVPAARTLLGGSIVIAALIAHLGLQWSRQPRHR